MLQAGLAYKRCFAAHTDYKSEAYQADLTAVHQQVGLCCHPVDLTWLPCTSRGFVPKTCASAGAWAHGA